MGLNELKSLFPQRFIEMNLKISVVQQEKTAALEFRYTLKQESADEELTALYKLF